MTTWNDPIVAEIHALREEHAARYQYDIAAIVAALQEAEHASGREFVRLPIKRRTEGHSLEPFQPVSTVEV